MLKNYQIQYLNIVRSVSVVSGVLITTGLLGTVIGLIITVSGISNVLNAVGQDYEMMIRGMNKTVEGMGSAFYTTFFGGLLGGVVLRLLSTENSRSASRLIAACEHLGACWIMPLSRRAGRSSSMDLEKEFFQMKQVLSDFSKEADASLHATLSTVALQSTKAIACSFHSFSTRERVIATTSGCMRSPLDPSDAKKAPPRMTRAFAPSAM